VCQGDRVADLRLGAEEATRLREALTAAEFTVDGVRALVGVEAHSALARNETTPAIRQTADGSPLSTLTRLWPLQAVVSESAAVQALPGLVDPLVDAGLLERTGGSVRAAVDVRPYADDVRDWWVVADLTPGLDGRPRRMAADHVLGVSPASISLAQLTVRAEVDRALDLGAGSGVQSLHLSTHAGSVVATDVNERALRLAALTAAINDVALELRAGSLYEPVTAETFDLIVTNPPFVISPGRDDLLTYRDSGLPGDEVVRRVVVEGAGRLAPAGWLQVLANWAIVRDEPWDERLSGWIAPTGCDAWVVERERLDPARYVELWLDDAGIRGDDDYPARYDAWLSWLDAQRIEAIGLGWISLRNTARSQPRLRFERWPHDVEQPISGAIGGWARGADALDRHDDDGLAHARLLIANGVVEERIGPPGTDDPAAIVLRSHRGMRRARPLTTAEAGLVGACDGDLSVGEIVGALATILGLDAATLRAELLPAVRDLVMEGFLEFP
jgi:Methyltransferase small domain